MKKVVTVSLGSSRKDFEFKTHFLGHNFHVRRLGADDDTVKAWELMRRQQATADAIGLGEISDHLQVGLRTIESSNQCLPVGNSRLYCLPLERPHCAASARAARVMLAASLVTISSMRRPRSLSGGATRSNPL